MDVAVGSPLHLAIRSAVGGVLDAVEEAHREELDYDAFLAHRTVSRVRGTALVDGRSVPWTLIEKVTEGPELASPYLLDNGRREFAAYASALLDDLAPRVRAPRAHGALAEDDGRVTLWLEEIVHEGSRPLDADALLAAARDLGELAGRWLNRVPTDPWLFTGWITRHSQPGAYAEGLDVLAHEHPAAVEVLGERLSAAAVLVRGQGELRRVLESLPHTLCHHDAVGANVFRAGGGTVLIDWESVGPGPVGADLASLLLSSARRGDASAELVAAVLDDALHAYAAGVASVDLATVRRGFDAAAGLRWKLVRDLAASLERGEVPRRGSLPDEPPEQALRELVLLSDLQLDSARRVLG